MLLFTSSYATKIQMSYSKTEGSIGSLQSTVRFTFWPIHRHELSQFLASSLLMFTILMIQNIIRALKDSIVNTKISTEIIAFLKFWGVMPASFLMAIGYMWLVDRMKPSRVFYLVLSSFIIFFALFGFVIFPMQDALHLDKSSIDSLILSHPHLKWFIYLFANWGFSLFYIITELWPTAAFALLFWQFMNNITSVEQSKRFYPLFGLLGQTGLFFSGVFLTVILPNLTVLLWSPDNVYNKEHTHMAIAMSLVVAMGVIALVTFSHIHKHFTDKNKEVKLKIKKRQGSLLESIKMIMHSRYIRLITILLFCYGVSINLVEGPWKSQASIVYPTTEEYASFVGSYLAVTGIMTVVLVILCSTLVRYVGWLSTAIITPAIMLITGILFFASSNFSSHFSVIAEYFLIYAAPIHLAVYIGALQNVFVKSSKYTLFDATKEMSYVPLNDELKTKGKAAADMIGIKAGKSLGSFIPMLIFTIYPFATYTSISVYLMFIFAAVCIVWIYGTIALGKEYNAISYKDH